MNTARNGLVLTDNIGAVSAVHLAITAVGVHLLRSLQH